MIAVALSFPLLFPQFTLLGVLTLLTKLGTEFAFFYYIKRKLGSSLLLLIASSGISCYIGFLFLFIPKILSLPPHLVLEHPTFLPDLPWSTIIPSILLPGIISTILAKKTLSIPLTLSTRLGLVSSFASLLIYSYWFILSP